MQLGKKFLIAVVACLSSSVAQAAEPSVTVHLLDHTDSKETKSSFKIDWSNTKRGIVETKKLEGEAATAIIELLQANLNTEEQTNFCGHDPIYGIVAQRADGETLVTSLCFKCNTWVLPGKRYVIAGKAGAENNLCVELRKVIELPKALRKE